MNERTLYLSKAKVGNQDPNVLREGAFADNKIGIELSLTEDYGYSNQRGKTVKTCYTSNKPEEFRIEGKSLQFQIGEKITREKLLEGFRFYFVPYNYEQDHTNYSSTKIELIEKHLILLSKEKKDFLYCYI